MAADHGIVLTLLIGCDSVSHFFPTEKILECTTITPAPSPADKGTCSIAPKYTTVLICRPFSIVLVPSLESQGLLHPHSLAAAHAARLQTPHRPPNLMDQMRIKRIPSDHCYQCSKLERRASRQRPPSLLLAINQEARARKEIQRHQQSDRIGMLWASSSWRWRIASP